MSSCKCGPDCKCTDGDCGCNMGKCGCDPTECPKGETTVALKVEGMTCGGCVGGVKRALEAVEGVSSATVDLASKLATIKGTAKAPALIAAIEATGKKATGKSRIHASPHKHTHTPAAPTLTWRERTVPPTAGCACTCGPGCACVAGECGCAVGACACDPAVCAKTSLGSSSDFTIKLMLAAAVGALAGIVIAKKVL